MADEELKLTIKQEEFVRKMNEVQVVIQDTKKAMDDLNKTKPFNQHNVDALYEWQKKVRELEADLEDVVNKQKELVEENKEVTKTTEEVTESTDDLGEAAKGLSKKLGLAAIAIGLITKLTQAVVVAFKDTVAGAKALTVVSEVWKQITYNIATANLSITTFTTSLVHAIASAKLMNEIRDKERKLLRESSQLQIEYSKMYLDASNKERTAAERLKLGNETLLKHQELVKKDVEIVDEQLAQIAVALVARPESNDLLNKENDLLIKRNAIIAQGLMGEKQLQNQMNANRREMFQDYFDEIEERLKRQDEFQALSLKLMQDYEQTQIELLEGNDKIRAQRDYGLKQLEELRKQMGKLGKLSKEQEKQFAIIGAGIWVAFYEGLTEEAQKKLPQKDIDAISKVLLPQLQGLITKDLPAEMAKIKSWVASNKEFSIWNMLGLDPESDDDKEAIDAIKNAAGKMQDIFQDILDQRVEMAERERELLDTRISETQREIDLEAELMEAGYANNLSARQQYLAKLKTQRDQAIADEEKAIKQQMIAQKLIQTTNILSGVSEIIKTSAKFPVIGMILAAASIASLFAIWSQSKTKATKLEEGGSGTVTGRRHSQGGERFLDHVEIEQGEQWGVLSRRASGKYGDMFHDMVSSFNRDQMPEFVSPSISNNIRVDNNGPNQRLDRVIKEQQKMNEQMKQGQLITVGNKKIIKNGNKIRIVGL